MVVLIAPATAFCCGRMFTPCSTVGTQSVRSVGSPRLNALYFGTSSGSQASDSGAPIRLRPVNPPATARYWHPEELLQRCPLRVMVKYSGSFVEAASVPRIAELEQVVIEMMAEFVTQRAQECAERRDFFSHRRSRPHPDQHGFGSVVSKKLGRPLFPNSQRPGGKYPDAAIRDLVELRCSF